MKLTKGSKLVLQIKNSNNLTITNSSLTALATVEGIQDKLDSLGGKQLINPHFSFEDEKILWFGGKGSVVVVELSTLKQQILRKFGLKSPNCHIQPFAAIADYQREKYCVAAEFDGEILIVYSERGRESDSHILKEIFPIYDDVSSLCLSKNKLYGIIGGTSKVSAKEMFPCVSCFIFDKTLELITSINLPVYRGNGISRIIASSTLDDVYYIASQGVIFVLGYSAEKEEFVLLKTLIASQLSITPQIIVRNHL